MNVTKDQFIKEIQKRQSERKQRKIDTTYAIRDIYHHAVKRAAKGH